MNTSRPRLGKLIALLVALVVVAPSAANASSAKEAVGVHATMSQKADTAPPVGVADSYTRWAGATNYRLPVFNNDTAPNGDPLVIQAGDITKLTRTPDLGDSSSKVTVNGDGQPVLHMCGCSGGKTLTFSYKPTDTVTGLTATDWTLVTVVAKSPHLTKAHRLSGHRAKYSNRGNPFWIKVRVEWSRVYRFKKDKIFKVAPDSTKIVTHFHPRRVTWESDHIHPKFQIMVDTL
jgi:hypothetical protein